MIRDLKTLLESRDVLPHRVCPLYSDASEDEVKAAFVKNVPKIVLSTDVAEVFCNI